MRKLFLTATFLLAPSIAWAQCNGVFGSQQVCGSVSGGVPVATPISSLAIFTLNSAAVDSSFCSTAGAFLTRSTSGWICSTTQGTSVTIPTGIVFGVPTQNTSQINITTTNGGSVNQPFVFNANTTINTPFDWRWAYTGAAPTNVNGQWMGPDFYTYPLPSTSVDNHNLNYNGVGGTVYSDSGTVLGLMIGGNFTAIRRNTGAGGSTNPILGVAGSAVGGITGDAGSASGDSITGGLFSAYQNAWASSTNYDPITLGSVVGSIGRAIEHGASANNLSIADSVGIGGYVGVEGNISNAYGGFISVDSRTATMSKANNAYGLYIGPVAGAVNVNAALRTSGSGTVIFAGSQALSGNMIGGMQIVPIAKPIINKVKGGAQDYFTEASGGYLTTGTSTYTYQIVAKFRGGVNSVPSPATTTTSGFGDLSVVGHNNYIQWTAVEGAISYDVYRTVAGGAVTNTTGKIANVPFDFSPFSAQPLSPTPPAFADQGAVGDASSPPSGTVPVLQVDGIALADGGAGPSTGNVKASSLISGSDPLLLGINGSNQWRISGGNGNLLASTDNNVDIGQSGATRPRNLFLSGSLALSPTTIASLPTCNSAATGQLMYVSNGFSPVTYNLKVSSASTSAWTYPVWCGTDPTSVNAFAWTYH